MPLTLQPSAPNNSLPSQALGTTGFEPNQAATSPCTLGEIDHSIHAYAQLGCLAPSAGMVVATGCLFAVSVFAWNGQEPEATMPSVVKSWTCTLASCQ